ncbi:MAG: carbohydrate ABC transporter permease, partial [Haloplanus sp.]
MSSRTAGVGDRLAALTDDPKHAVVVALKYGFGVLASLWMLFPIYWMVLTSLQSRSTILDSTPTFLPLAPTFSNYATLFVENEFLSYLTNSFIVATAAVTISVIIGVPAAYSLSRMDIPGDHHISFWILSTRMVPPLSILVPLYVFLSGAGLTRSLVGLTITHFLITLP